MLQLHSTLLPRAASVYAEQQRAGWPDDDCAQGDAAAWVAGAEGDGDSEAADSDSDSGGDDEWEAAHRAAARRSRAARGGGWHLSRGAVLVGLLLLVLVGELLVFLDMFRTG